MKQPVAAILLVALMLLSACSDGAADSAESTIGPGTYLSAETTTAGRGGLTLTEAGEFTLSVEVYSYCPMGTYTFEGNTLILHINGDESNAHVFTIQDGALVFESGTWLENTFAPGAVFELVEE